MSNRDNPIIEYGPNRISGFFIAIGSFLFLFFFWLMITKGKQDLSHTIVAYGCLSIFLLALLLGITRLFSRAPLLRLNKHGVYFETLVGYKSWKWEQLGPLNIDIIQYRFHRMIVLCAYSDLRHDILEKSGETPKPSIHDADIQITVSQLAAGNSEHKATKLAEELNQWREKYGKPENNADDIPENQHQSIITHTKNKRRRNKILYVCIIIIGAFLYGYTRK